MPKTPLTPEEMKRLHAERNELMNELRSVLDQYEYNLHEGALVQLLAESALNTMLAESAVAARAAAADLECSLSDFLEAEVARLRGDHK